MQQRTVFHQTFLGRFVSAVVNKIPAVAYLTGCAYALYANLKVELGFAVINYHILLGLCVCIEFFFCKAAVCECRECIGYKIIAVFLYDIRRLLVDDRVSLFKVVCEVICTVAYINRDFDRVGISGLECAVCRCPGRCSGFDVWLLCSDSGVGFCEGHRFIDVQ